MDDPQLVGADQGAGQLPADEQGARQGKRSLLLLQGRPQLLALHILEHQEEAALIEAPIVVGGGDVGVVKVGGGHRLALKARQHRRVAHHVGAQHLERHPLADARVVDKVYGTHAALPEEPLDLVASNESRANQRRGSLGRLRDLVRHCDLGRLRDLGHFRACDGLGDRARLRECDNRRDDSGL